MPARARIVLFLGGSGFCAAIYVLTWIRELRLIFGDTLPATAAVLAVFFAGLALGHRLSRQRAATDARPLALFAMAQLGAALFAALSPITLLLAETIYAASGGSSSLGLGGATAVRVISSALVVVPGAALLGGSMLLAERAFDVPPARLWTSALSGAALGTFVATFTLLALFGTQLTLWLSCTLQLLAAVLARATSRSLDDTPPQPSRTTRSSSERIAEIAVLAAGFACLLVQLVWLRVLVPLFGDSLFAGATLVAVVLGGLALGALVRARWPVEGTLAHVGGTFAFGALALALPFLLGDRIALGALMARSFAIDGLLGYALGWGVISTLVALPAAVVAGYQLSLVSDMAGSVRAHTSFFSGAALACIAGAFFIPAANAATCWQLAAWLMAIGAAVLLAAHLRQRSSHRTTVGISGVAAALGALVFAGTGSPTPVLRHASIGDGSDDRVLLGATMNDIQRWLRFTRRAHPWQAEGVGASIAIRATREVDFVVGGRSGGAAISGAGTQLTSGVVATLRHPSPKRVMIIGLGNGSMAGAIAELDGIEAVDVVETEPAMTRVAEACAAVNGDVLKNGRVRVLTSAPREALLTTTSAYDVVIAGPTALHQPSAFTREFYAAIRERAGQGGVFAQIVRASDFDLVEAGTIYATMASVFGAVETWQTQHGHLMLVAGDLRPIDVVHTRSRIAQPALRTALYAGWHAGSLEDVLGHYVAGPDVAKVLAAEAGERINSDDDNAIELSLARKGGRGGDFDGPSLRALATRLEAQRPQLTGDVDWQRVADARMNLGLLLRKGTPDRASIVAPAQQQRFIAMRAWASGDMATAAASWDTQETPAVSPTEIIVLAEVYASLGDDRALALIERARAFDPVSAQVILARFLLAKRDVKGSVKMLVAALEAYRVDPWAAQPVMRRGLDAAQDLARMDRVFAVALAKGLSAPFAVRSLDFARTRVLLDVGTLAGDGACMLAIDEAGENFPWEQTQLVRRIRCMELTKRGDLALARRELEQFVDDEGIEVDVAFLPPK